MWGSCHLPVSYFLYLRKSYPAHMACFCAEAEHMHTGSTQDRWRRRNSIYLSQIRVTAPLSSHRHKQFFHQPSHWNTNSDLAAFLTWQKDGNPGDSSADTEGITEGTTTATTDADKRLLTPPPSTSLSFHLLCSQGGICATTLWCSVTGEISTFQSPSSNPNLRLWH